MTTIVTPSGKPYITVENREVTVALRLHTYDDFRGGIWVHLDKKCLPDLINVLTDIMESENGTSM